MSTHERIGYVDIAKAIGIISVIIGHMWWYQPEMNLMYSFHMPLFFLIGGFFIKRRKSFKEIVHQKAVRLLSPYIFTCAAIMLVTVLMDLFFAKAGNIGSDLWGWFLASLYGSGSLTSPVFNIHPIGPIWFLLAMFQALVIYNFVFGTRWAWPVCIALFAIGYAGAQWAWIPFSIWGAFTSLLFIHIGHETKNIIVSHIKLPYAVVALGIWAVCFMYTGLNFEIDVPMSMARCYYSNVPLNILGGFAGTFVILYASKWIEKCGKIGSWFETYGRNSLVVLCFHTLELEAIPWDDLLPLVGLTPMTIDETICKLVWSVLWVFVAIHYKPLHRIFGVVD